MQIFCKECTSDLNMKYKGKKMLYDTIEKIDAILEKGVSQAFEVVLISQRKFLERKKSNEK